VDAALDQACRRPLEQSGGRPGALVHCEMEEHGLSSRIPLWRRAPHRRPSPLERSYSCTCIASDGAALSKPHHGFLRPLDLARTSPAARPLVVPRLKLDDLQGQIHRLDQARELSKLKAHALRMGLPSGESVQDPRQELRAQLQMLMSLGMSSDSPRLEPCGAPCLAA